MAMLDPRGGPNDRQGNKHCPSAVTLSPARATLGGTMFTMILLVYLQAGLTVSLAGATVSGEYPTQAECEKAAVRARGPLPIPRSYNAAWQDAICTRINRDVKVGNERVTEFDKLLYAALQPRGCESESACRRAGIRKDKPDR